MLIASVSTPYTATFCYTVSKIPFAKLLSHLWNLDSARTPAWINTISWSIIACFSVPPTSKYLSYWSFRKTSNSYSKRLSFVFIIRLINTHTSLSLDSFILPCLIFSWNIPTNTRKYSSNCLFTSLEHLLTQSVKFPKTVKLSTAVSSSSYLAIYTKWLNICITIVLLKATSAKTSERVTKPLSVFLRTIASLSDSNPNKEIRPSLKYFLMQYLYSYEQRHENSRALACLSPESLLSMILVTPFIILSTISKLPHYTKVSIALTADSRSYTKSLSFSSSINRQAIISGKTC
jgi:hypothetical protein